MDFIQLIDFIDVLLVAELRMNQQDYFRILNRLWSDFETATRNLSNQEARSVWGALRVL